MQVIPAILPHGFEEILEKITRIEGICPLIQIDVCDGVFGREKTWMPMGDELLPASFAYEFDLMVADWRTYIPKCISLGVKKIVVHVDQFVDGDVDLLVAMVGDSGVALGVAVSNDTSIDFHIEIVRAIQEKYTNVYAQVMGIRKIGEQGQFFDEEALSRIITLKKTFGQLFIQIDGGMKPDTAKQVLNAGADAVVVGSYIFGKDAVIAYEELSAIEREGVC